MDKLLTVGADPFPPYQYYNENHDVKGSDYEIVKKIFNHAEYKIKVILNEWKKIEDLVINKKIDAAFQVQYTIEREKKYFFSGLFRNAVTEVITGNKSLDLKSYFEIEEKKLSVGVINNYTYGDDVDKIDSSLKKSFDEQNKLLKAINDRILDIGIFDKGVKEYLIKKEGFDNIFSIKNLEFIRPLYVIFSSKKLKDSFNRSLKDLFNK